MSEFFRTRNGSKIRTTRTRMSKPEPDPDLNSNMTSCPNFKFEHKFCDCTRFFSGRTDFYQPYL